jgi:hypothetical protein
LLGVGFNQLSNIFRYRPPENDPEKAGSDAKLQDVTTFSFKGEQQLSKVPITIKPVTPNSFVARLFGYSQEPLLRRLFCPSSQKCNQLTSRIVNVFAVLTGKLILSEQFYLISVRLTMYLIT